jgi:small-conductance mechanosensitive channel
MELLTKWSDSIQASLQVTWDTFLRFFPSLIAALVVIVIGAFVSATLGRVVVKVFDKLCVDTLIKKTGVFLLFEKSGIKFSVSKFVGGLVKWFMLIVFFIAAADILSLVQITDFLNKVLMYIPNVVVAVVIMLVGAIVAHFLGNIVRTAVDATKIGPARFLSGLTYYSIVIFASMAALIQLGIAADLVETLFTGFVAMLALAGGLAFGLGGKDLGKEVLEKIKKDFS